ncbi:MAG TPA: PadR family transcriptional regulator [Acidimicrobiales bacterium]|nr:PadR family transcriptional regulator [Acidimicrobiales bacterium]
MLELAILGLLKEQELHGYELKKRLVDTLGFASGVSFGSLYPALSRLESAGAVKAVESRPTAATAVPHTGSLAGELAAFRARKASSPRGSRNRKVYGITDRGERLFDELLAAESQSNDDERLFNLRLAFARYLPPDLRLGMLERRRAHLVERLIQLRARVLAARDSYARSLVEHDQEAAQHDLTWIERLIASERAGHRPDGTAGGVAGPDRPAGPPAGAHDRTGLRAGPDGTAGLTRRAYRGDSPTLAGLRPTEPFQPGPSQEDSNQ